MAIFRNGEFRCPQFQPAFDCRIPIGLEKCVCYAGMPGNIIIFRVFQSHYHLRWPTFTGYYAIQLNPFTVTIRLSVE